MKVQICWMAEKKPDFVSRMIMKYDKSDFSHVLIRFMDRHGLDSIYHATGRGVHIEPFDPYLHNHKVVSFKKIELDISQEFFWGYVSGSDGKEYSRWQIVRIFTGINLFKNNKTKMICSETVGELMHFYSDYKLEGDRDLWTPKYLHEKVFG